MQGYKTVLTGLLSVLMGVATMAGVTLDPDTVRSIANNVDLVIGGGMSLYGTVMILLRAVTKSPMFKKAE